jgi:parallel beta-helix repeat protein
MLSRLYSGVSSGHLRQVRDAFARKPRIEPLEDRRLLTITVNTLVDGIGVSGTSLREAIAAAAEGETINFSVTGTINLVTGSTNDNRHLTINKSLTISGPGADLLTIKAFDPTPATKNADGSRALYIGDGNINVDKTVSISGLTLTGGDFNESGGLASAGGGAILNAENLTVNECTISGNAAFNNGGGIFNYRSGSLTVNGSTISGNTTNGNRGGGIYTKYAPLVMNSSTISGNRAHGWGGGIFASSANVTIAHSTITGNQADIHNNQDPLFNIRGGGIYSYETGSVTVRHTIVAGNTRAQGTRDDVFGPVAAQFSLIGDSSGAIITNQGGNQIGPSNMPINAMLGPLANNGGRTLTHALLSGSPAIDRGNASAVAGAGGVPLYDQRGAPFTRVANGDSAGGARIDIGAFEVQSSATAASGDYNRNGKVDGGDYVIWRKTLNSNVVAFAGADGDGDGRIDQDDFNVWRSHFGQTVSGAGAGMGINQESPLSQSVSVGEQKTRGPGVSNALRGPVQNQAITPPASGARLALTASNPEPRSLPAASIDEFFQSSVEGRQSIGSRSAPLWIRTVRKAADSGKLLLLEQPSKRIILKGTDLTNDALDGARDGPISDSRGIEPAALDDAFEALDTTWVR